MSAPLRLTAAQARLVHLGAQGLLAPPPGPADRETVLSAIARMHLLQIDTIHVVARSPYLVLFSRVGPYPSAWLDELLAEGALLECWAHEACFAPIDDYLLLRRHQLERTSHWAQKSADRVHARQGEALRAFLDHVRERGPVLSRDFARTEGRSGGWWGWKDEKRWLEALFARGELMILRRERFQRVYDLRERVIGRVRPQWVEAPLPSLEEVRREQVLRTVRALGVTQAGWVADYFRIRGRHRDGDLDPLVDEGLLERVEVAGWSRPGYVHRDQRPLAERAAAGRLRATRTTLLSPFDPVVWDRARALALFGFDYRIECYTPAPRRRFGYFVLPILSRGRLVGRLDAKAHRADRVFEVKKLFLEPGVPASAALARDLAAALRECAEWHLTPKVVVRRTDPRGFGPVLRQALRRARRLDR